MAEEKFIGNSHYTIDVSGTVTNKVTGKILKHNTVKCGYKQVSIYINKKRKSFLVHRLIAMYFLDNPNNYPDINHKDKNPSNNHIDNLEWCTPSMNVLHSYQNGRQKLLGIKHPLSKLTNEEVSRIKRMNGSYISIAASFNVSCSTIRLIKIGRIWTHIL